MRSMKINQGWTLGMGLDNAPEWLRVGAPDRTVDLPHDYMIESDVYAGAPAGGATGFYNAAVAHYVKEIDIPAAWEGERIALRLDGAMMNATVEVNGALACLQHYGYAPFEADITRLTVPGKKNRVCITVNPSMQPNSRWYSGAGLFRGVELAHMPKLHVAFGGLYGVTKKIEYGADGKPVTAFLQVSAEIRNGYAENRLAEVTFTLTDNGTGAAVRSSRTVTQVQALSSATARMTLTVDDPLLWDAEHPRLYRLQAAVKDAGTFTTHIVPNDHPTEDTESVLFGIRTVEADVKHGLRINGKTVKLRGGCLHHDNGPIGAVSVYDAEARKVRKLKEVGFNAIRTTHNPPSAALIEACDRLGMYVFDEAFDVWGMGKQPGDYNQYFATDWEKDLTAFVKRDRCHPCVILWSTGNEITERGGLNDGYVLASKLAETIRRLDPGRPVSNGICSFWNGLDDEMRAEQQRLWAEGSAAAQNADPGGAKDLLWERYTEAFANGLDVVGYNYMEPRYEQDHRLFPERVILGSENYPKEVGLHWPMIEKTPWVIGEFTWTAWDYIGEAGIGKAAFYEPGDPRIGDPWGSAASPFPWRTANDADFDVTGQIRPQGVYRGIVWGSGATGLFSYDPDVTGKAETLSLWGFPGVWARWNWQGREGRPVDIAVFSAAEEVELFVNGVGAGRKKAGEALIHGMPLTFLFRTEYRPGTVEAVSYTGGKEVSRAALRTAGKPVSIRLTAETDALKADGESLCYVNAELLDEAGRVVPDADTLLRAEVTGAASLLGFGSGNPVTDENYGAGRFTAYQGRALAVLRAGCEAGEARLTVAAEALGLEAEITLPVRGQD
ncbi:MAG: DUF4982 domain-containing protein [Clostridia bacterium]|nr:DUF4982 domain-containing protein [Clostridia bacterium]